MWLDLTRDYINRSTKMSELTPQKVHMSKLDLMALLIVFVALVTGIVVLLAQSVGAETIGEKKIREAGDSWVPCSQLYGPAGSECRVKGEMIEVRPTCEQRMREAMRIIDAYVKTSTDLIQQRPLKQHREQWDQTMRECIK